MRCEFVASASCFAVAGSWIGHLCNSETLDVLSSNFHDSAHGVVLQDSIQWAYNSATSNTVPETGITNFWDLWIEHTGVA